MEQAETSQARPKRERALPSRVIQIGQAEELTEDDIRSALEVFGEIRYSYSNVLLYVSFDLSYTNLINASVV
jgi:hypothetical protein